MDHLLLIRHGITDANEQLLLAGRTDVPINENGRKKLLELKAAGGYPDISNYHVFTSGLKRTEQTLEVLFGDVPHTAMPEFLEIDFGDFEMKSYSEMNNFRGLTDNTDYSSEEVQIPGGESTTDVAKRVASGLAKLKELDGDCLVVCHGGAIFALMNLIYPGEKTLFEWSPEGGHGYMLDFTGEKVTYKNVP